MNPEIFSEWLRRQGHRVYRTESSYWYDAVPRVLLAFPYHKVIQPTEGELFHLILKDGIIALRYSTPIQAPQGKVSYHVIYDQPGYTLEKLERRTRQNVRAGLTNCTVESIPLERLAEEGWQLEADTANRQGRVLVIDREKWQRKIKAAIGLPGFESWGALVDGQLVASLFSFQMEDCCEFLTQHCKREFLSARVNHALSFTVTELMLNRPGIRSIFYTMQSLDAPPSVDDFKFRMGYIPKLLRQRLVFHPCLKGLVRLAGPLYLQRMMPDPEKKTSLSKLRGMISFYLEGLRPLQDQQWPECLDPYKAAFFQS